MAVPGHLRREGRTTPANAAIDTLNSARRSGHSRTVPGMLTSNRLTKSSTVAGVGYGRLRSSSGATSKIRVIARAPTSPATSTSRPPAWAVNAEEVEIADDNLVADRRVGAAGSLGWHHRAIFGRRQMRRSHQPAGFIWMRSASVRGLGRAVPVMIKERSKEDR
jgi:hypothetical protein